MTKKKLPVRFTGQHFTIDKVLIKDAIRQALDELEDWQRDLIEKIRVGVELKDDDIVKAMGY